MGDVDFMDHLISHYLDGFKNKRWLLCIFFFKFLNIMNAWILYHQSEQPSLLFYFKASVTTSLTQKIVAGNKVRKR